MMKYYLCIHERETGEIIPHDCECCIHSENDYIEMPCVKCLEERETEHCYFEPKEEAL